mmetsp:Transcript_56969/g.133244  ORF Transcript_56969/g.133244 Transcript_56969/m.133244 type:complete len:554 (-) Transcript_56969:20-1681(-)
MGTACASRQEERDIAELIAFSPQLWRAKVIANSHDLEPPSLPSLLDNTLLFLPPSAVQELGVQANMDDKGDPSKQMWFGRVWHVRQLLHRRYQELRRNQFVPKERQEVIQARFVDNEQHLHMLVKVQIRWKLALIRKRNNFSFLSRLKFANLRGTLIYAHGSGGCSWDNMRICRMICRMGFLVIAPDDFAYPRGTAMGNLRHKDLQPLHLATDDVDYWAPDLIYASQAEGESTYSTKAEEVLNSPDRWMDMYEKCYQMRRSELHFIISKLPRFILAQGFFLGGTSEGAMTIARFDDQRYGKSVLGRFINSFSVEYCYFTPKPEDGQIGGQKDVPTLNIIGSKDEYFGGGQSVAKIVVEDGMGYGDKNLTGNAYKTFVRQGLHHALVCLLEDGTHGPCITHDNQLREIFNTFFTRPHDIWQIERVWACDPPLAAMVRVLERSDKNLVGENDHVSKVTKVFVPLSKMPSKMSLRDVQALREISPTSEAFRSRVTDVMAEQKKLMEQESEEAQSMLRKLRQKGIGSRLGSQSVNFYAQEDNEKTYKKEMTLLFDAV